MSRSSARCVIGSTACTRSTRSDGPIRANRMCDISGTACWSMAGSERNQSHATYTMTTTTTTQPIMHSLTLCLVQMFIICAISVSFTLLYFELFQPFAGIRNKPSSHQSIHTNITFDYRQSLATSSADSRFTFSD